ncbi:hypothetical protein THASP1DRAFT_22170 [Thamnocephalis sphaerospora]|uniref:Uncharacterized protein n=1 Tax=Thamnocephalis sphaerospora TaxID=78915 RepID=A0A4P9XUY3_9FUNG|nr:hypothetical protein THASP1DRAFT_22170 [Thamnocephalis sphaerospora]|eukprot:RKP10064.1 hypothetical protein THASP1DRAFT_22170 [Thamnocephalis sphaerospora]
MSSQSTDTAPPTKDPAELTSARPLPGSGITLNPHRCNAHLEDFLAAVQAWPPQGLAHFRVWSRCMRSKPGGVAKSSNLSACFRTIVAVTYAALSFACSLARGREEPPRLRDAN